jgi:hypothetical protein
MPSCERCWRDAGARAYSKQTSTSEEYQALIAARECTPEQQAGEDATECPKCSRRTCHQYCHVCMACNYDPEAKAQS